MRQLFVSSFMMTSVWCRNDSVSLDLISLNSSFRCCKQFLGPRLTLSGPGYLSGVPMDWLSIDISRPNCKYLKLSQRVQRALGVREWDAKPEIHPILDSMGSFWRDLKPSPPISHLESKMVIAQTLKILPIHLHVCTDDAENIGFHI